MLYMDDLCVDEIQVTTPYGRIAGRTAGPEDGRVVLGLHGWSERNGWHTWQPVLPLLAAAGFRAIAVDMLGWGESESSYSRAEIADAAVKVVLSIVEQVSADEQVVLMGKSWGGGVALSLALDYPERVSHLLLTAPAFPEKERLTSLAQPVLLAWAEDDPVIPIAAAAEYAERVPTLELVVYPTGGHSAAPKNAADFAERAVSFLEMKTDVARAPQETEST